MSHAHPHLMRTACALTLLAGALAAQATPIPGNPGGLTPPHLDPTKLYTLLGEQPRTAFQQEGLFGVSIAAIGDVSNPPDGVSDLAIAAPQQNGSSVNLGIVRVVSGVNGAEIYRVQGLTIGEAFGTAVAAAGDMNADGVPDFIVGAPRFTAAGSLKAGRVDAISGATGARIWTRDASLVFPGAATDKFFGSAVASLGDLTGDGRPEVVAGAPCQINSTQPGFAVILSGTGLVLQTVTGLQGGDHFGAAVAGILDRDADGFGDLVVGAVPEFNLDRKGYVRVLRSSNCTDIVPPLQGDQTRDSFGHAVMGMGDLDGDGLGDFAVGAPGTNPNTLGGTYAKLFKSGGQVHFMDGLSNFDEFGVSLARVGDIDQDGYEDLLVGATQNPQFLQLPGYFQLRSGRNGKRLLTVNGDPINDPLNWGDAFGISVAGLGDVDGDHHPDVAAGAYLDDDAGLNAGTVTVFSLR